MKNKIALITGASSGIGEATAHRLAELGAHLILVARREDKLLQVAETLKAKGTQVLAKVLDVRDATAVFDFIATLPAPFSNIEILINNAGCALGLDTLVTADPADSIEMIDTNIKGLLYLSHTVLPGMLARGKGHVVNLGSTAAHNVYPGGAVYCATKHAVKAITRAVQLEVAGKGIRVTEIDPGAVETEFSLIRFKGDAARAKKVYENMALPLTGADVADAIVYALTCPAHVNIAQIVLYSADQTERLPS